MRGFEMDACALRGGFLSLRSLFFVDHFIESPPGSVFIAIEEDLCTSFQPGIRYFTVS